LNENNHLSCSTEDDKVLDWLNDWHRQTINLHGVYLASLFSQIHVGRAGIRDDRFWSRILA